VILAELAAATDEERQYLREVDLAAQAENILQNRAWQTIFAEQKQVLTEKLLELPADAFEDMREVKIALQVTSALESRVEDLIETGRMAQVSLKEIQDGRGASKPRTRRKRRAASG
jgi:hypothetical protein